MLVVFSLWRNSNCTGLRLNRSCWNYQCRHVSTTFQLREFVFTGSSGSNYHSKRRMLELYCSFCSAIAVNVALPHLNSTCQDCEAPCHGSQWEITRTVGKTLQQLLNYVNPTSALLFACLFLSFPSARNTPPPNTWSFFCLAFLIDFRTILHWELPNRGHLVQIL